MNRLAMTRFLIEEVRGRDYADLLIERASAAAKGQEAPGASGNGYYVDFQADAVVIEHHYLEGRPELRLTHRDFIAALAAWRAGLEE